MAERRLGRGLDSLISRTAATIGAAVVELNVESVQPNPEQPRQVMNEAALEGLARSIRQMGVLQPIIVQQLATGYQLVAGERRLRASKLAGRPTIPAIVIEAQGAKSLELALIENIQRENLGALEEAAAFEALLAKAQLTHQDLADRIGKSRASVTNTLRLLDLPDGVKRLLQTGALSAGQGRALLAAGNPERMQALADAACRGNWSVREIERQSLQPSAGRSASKSRRRRESKGVFADYEEQLRTLFGTKVTITDNEGRGEVRFACYSSKDRDRLIHLLLAAGTAAADESSRDTGAGSTLRGGPH